MSVIPEAKINCSTQPTVESLKNVVLEPNEVVISFDVTSLYTNVPVKEAIREAAERLYSGDVKVPPVDKETFIALATVSCTDVVMSTHEGTYKQVDGLAMGSPPAPLLANIWLSKYEPSIKDTSKLFERFMDDILRTISSNLIKAKLAEINSLHPKLKFTLEIEENKKLPFLDILIKHSENKLTSSWHCKPTDTGLILNFRAMAPKCYKRSVIQGFVHRVYRSCSSWKKFHESLTKAKRILERNQYPPSFYDPIILDTIEKLVNPLNNKATDDKPESDCTTKKVHLVLQYRGLPTENFIKQLKQAKAPIQPIITMKKLRSFLPSLKPEIQSHLKSCVVYKITCPGCTSCYVGQTRRHLITRFKEHMNHQNKPTRKHFELCTKEKPKLADLKILASTIGNIEHLMTLEALFIREIKPKLNTKDEYRTRELTKF